MDLFNSQAKTAPARPIPWSTAPGFTSSEPWRAYCEAWEYAMALIRGELPIGFSAIARHRGDAALDRFKAHIAVVQRDLAGKVTPRNQLFSLIA